MQIACCCFLIRRYSIWRYTCSIYAIRWLKMFPNERFVQSTCKFFPFSPSAFSHHSFNFIIHFSSSIEYIVIINRVMLYYIYVLFRKTRICNNITFLCIDCILYLIGLHRQWLMPTINWCIYTFYTIYLSSILLY